jgi:Reverse transcriptase (RNA-dependent DNA polymerase)
VQGFTQMEGIDFDETFTPVAKFTSLCTILALAAKYNLEVHQLDIKSAYLNEDLKEEIYMAPPPGFDTPEGMVLKLNTRSTIVITVEKQVSSGRITTQGSDSVLTTYTHEEQELKNEQLEPVIPQYPGSPQDDAIA